MFGGKKMDLTHMAFAFGLILVASFFGNKFRQAFTNSENNDEYELVKKYLLNDSALYGKNRPKLWIHSKYEYNVRKWKNFMSRGNSDLNQPYLYLTIQSIINHCGDDFHICLVDDESFEKLIPSWTMDLSTVPEPMRSRYRNIAMMQLLYIYGGMIVPNSFLCMKNLKPLYDQEMLNNKPFVCENVNKSVDLMQHKNPPVFSASTYFMGSPKNDAGISSIVSYMKNRNARAHFTDEYQFKNDVATYLRTMKENNEISILDGAMVGVKTSKGKPIILDHLMEQQPLDLAWMSVFRWERDLVFW